MVKVLDKVSEVCKIWPKSGEGLDKVLHKSNSRPLDPPGNEETHGGEVELDKREKDKAAMPDVADSEKELDENEEERPDMAEVLKRFGLNDST